jgi:predicted ATPase
MLTSIIIDNFLSYGQKTRVPLGALNVIVGPNASGKSNMLDAIRLLHSLPDSLSKFLASGGGASEWVWKGPNSAPRFDVGATIKIKDFEISYSLSVEISGQQPLVRLESVTWKPDRDPELETVVYSNGLGNNLILAKTSNRKELDPAAWTTVQLDRDEISVDQSVLSYRKEPRSYPVLWELSKALERVSVYSSVQLGRASAIRIPKTIGLPGDLLLDGFANLAHVLNDIDRRPGGLAKINERLQQAYGVARRVVPRIIGEYLQIYVDEDGLSTTVPASRLSDGTLRYLCLLAMLLHPEPSPLICIEDPEIGMHPDMIPIIADLLKDAATRTQIVVTTHSDLLISSLSDTPESVLVCDRTPSGTQVKRLDNSELQSWLNDYSLGEVWLKGAIGGTRW